MYYFIDKELFEKKEVAYNEPIGFKEEPTREGYSFSGWNGLPSVMPDHDVVVTGTFQINYHKLTYLVDGEVYQIDSVAFNSQVSPAQEPTREGYRFSGWNGLPATMPDHDVEVTGTFEISSHLNNARMDSETYYIYDLSGRVAKVGSGLYIINGKKVLIK